MPGVGDVIASKYELARLLGRGSMGEVWIAHHLSLDEDVALKLLSSGTPEDVENRSTATARFRFEAQIAARLSRKTRHIVRVTDHGEEGGLAYLVMELLDGETLETRLQRGGCLGLEEASTLVAQVARALAEAHDGGVIHRDLKPANIFLASDEDGGRLVKLLDFGIARTIRTHQVATSFATGIGLVFGTPGYMSPEQVSPLSRLDHRCDLWALATVAYESLTRQLPVEGAHPEELFRNLCVGRVVPVHVRRPDLPAALAEFFARAFASKIKDRYGSALELAQAFERAVAPSADAGDGKQGPGRGTLNGHAAPVARPARSQRRGEHEGERDPRTARRLVAVAAVGLLGLTGAAGAWHELSRSTARLAMVHGPTAVAPADTPLEAAAIRPLIQPPASLEELPPPVLVTAPATVLVPSVLPAPPRDRTDPPVAPPERPISRAASSALRPASPVTTPSRPGKGDPPAAARKAMDKSEVL
jgi:eukaryotic-like serine/threonine-protein kinase